EATVDKGRAPRSRFGDASLSPKGGACGRRTASLGPLWAARLLVSPHARLRLIVPLLHGAMNGLRRALLLGLPRLRGRPLLGSGGGGASVLSRRFATSDLWRWQTAAIALHEGQEEEFVFPEYLPENPDAERKQLAPEKEHAQPREAKSEVLPERTRSERLRQRLQERRRKAAGGEHKVSGRPDPSVPTSGVSCSGCGAELHCQDPAVPGYLPSEKYRSLVGLQEPQLPQEEDGVGPKDREPAEESSQKQQALKDARCQRCWLLVHHRRALQVQMPREEYHNVVSSALRSPPRHGRPHLVLCMVDLLDLPDSILTDLPDLVGSEAHIFVLGNKVDLLPRDSNNYLKRLQEQLRAMCARAGLLESGNQRVVDVHLISAKTGYGVEELISKLQRSWKFNGNVFLIGATNSGKSTLFNTLLHSDYCKSRASEAINRATISPWPGTTLNLLKFPIINPTPYRIFRRKERLKADAEKAEEDLSEDEQEQLNRLKKQSYLVGRIGRTFLQTQKLRKNNEIEFDAEALSFSMEEEPYVPSKTATKKIELSYNEVKDARWFHDTPGIIKDGCVLNLLNENEIKLVLPTTAIVPRTFILKPGMTLFLGALGRIDYLQAISEVLDFPHPLPPASLHRWQDGSLLAQRSFWTHSEIYE
ncbi:Nitric oxide-associated protein 1, partial [Varanus komodoensis]